MFGFPDVHPLFGFKLGGRRLAAGCCSDPRPKALPVRVYISPEHVKIFRLELSGFPVGVEVVFNRRQLDAVWVVPAGQELLCHPVESSQGCSSGCSAPLPPAPKHREVPSGQQCGSREAPF